MIPNNCVSVSPYSHLTVGDLDKGLFTEEEAERLLAAEEFCWAFGSGIALGFLDDVPLAFRYFFAAQYEVWNQLAVKTGIMPKDNEAENYEPGPVPGYML